MPIKRLPFYLLFAIFVCFFVSGCSFKEPVLPSWESDFDFPFAIDDIILGEELGDSTTFIVKDGDPNSILWISLNDTANLQEISARQFSVQPGEISKTLTLDTLTIDTLDVLFAPALHLGDLLPELSALVGQTVTIPETTLFAPELPVPAKNFKRAHFLSGKIRLTMTNNLPVSIGPNSSSAGLRVRVLGDSLPNIPFADVLFDSEIAPNSTATAEADISNRWLVAPLRVAYEIPIAASSQQLITNELLNDFGLSIRLELFDIRADEVTAIVEPQQFDGETKIAYDDDTVLREAVISKGKILLDLTNFAGLGSRVELTIPAVRNAQDQPFVETFDINARSTLHRELVLDGFRVINPDQPGELLDSLAASFTAETFAPGGFVTVRSSDSVAAKVSADSIFFESLSGRLGQQTLDFDPIIQDNVFDYQGFDGGVELSEALLAITVFSEVLFDNLNADIRITAYHRDERGVFTDSVKINLNNQAFIGGQPGTPGKTEIILSGDQHPEVLDVVNIFPTTFRVSGTARASGNVDVAVGQRIWAEYSFETPIKARISGLAKIEGDTGLLTDANIDKLVRDAADENILSASLNFALTNHTPIDVNMRFIVTADIADSDIYDANLDTSLAIVREFPMNAAPVDPQTGLTTSPQTTNVEIALNRREIRLFKNPPLRYGFELFFNDTNGFVTLRYSDFVRMLGEVKTHVLVKN